jgi:hypothetical protein
MKRISVVFFIIFVSFNLIKAQQAGLALYAVPNFAIVKYKDFNTFASGYNQVNGSNLKLPKLAVGFTTGLDAYYGFFYFGLNYNKLSISPTPIVLSDYSERHIEINSKSWVANIGWNIGRGAYSLSPYMICGMDYLDFDTYIQYFGEYKSYGNYKLDGTYSGTNMLLGFGLKVNYFYKIFFGSIGISQIYSVLPTASIHDFGAKGEPDFGGGYTDIGTDWASYSTSHTWDYAGKYMSSAHNQFVMQLTVGIFIGGVNNKSDD